LNSGITQRVVSRVNNGCPARSIQDDIAIEEPLEIRVAGDPVAVTMRSPGNDSRLAVGFLFSEGIIASIEDIGRVYHCGRPGTEAYGNAIDVLPAPGHSLDIERVSASRRGTLTTSACGVCGRLGIADLVERCSVLPPGPKISAKLLSDTIENMTRIQPTFTHTGGVHAAAAFGLDGCALVCSEDVGRHNAVDKTVGALLFDRLVGASRGAVVLAVSGRSSFEIVQKAAVARIPIVASVSAASSLAVDLATDVGITLAGFVRRKGFNLYAHPERIVP
jgi:FdhD protein